MMTHKQRFLMAARGELPDTLPYVPRIDLWYNANSAAGTLPEKYRGMSQDDISRSEGWAFHKIVPEFLKVREPEDSIHRALGIYSLKETVFKCKFAPTIHIDVKRDGDYTTVEYRTPVGTVSTKTSYTDEMRKSGASITWIQEHIIKRPEDYRVVAYIFENLELVPDFTAFLRWKEEIGEWGVPCTMVGLAASPMHHIQKEFLDATEFYFQYNDYYKEMRGLALSMENFFDQALRIIAESPAEGVLWGGNFDDMITYPSYFGKEIQPWIRKGSEVLGEKGKLCICHCDGENFGLMDLIGDSGMHVADAICPYPMTKVRIEEYYARWSEKLTIFGGIPSNMLLAESATEEEFEAYLDHLFKVVAPGKRMILGIADTTPPNAVFDRLIRIGERVAQEGRLPLEAGSFRPLDEAQLAGTVEPSVPGFVPDEDFQLIQQDVLSGNHVDIKIHVRELLDRNVPAKEILERGMLSAMESIGVRFKGGEVYIPEVLLSARAMNECLPILEPYLAGQKRDASGKVLIGTVRGDMHDIGKNMVATMLRGVGFEVLDIGINISVDEFVRRAAEYKPDILGLSALLTTTMAEMKKVIHALETAGLRDKLKVIVGGAPVNEKFALDIGADGYAHDAGAAVPLAKSLLKG